MEALVFWLVFLLVLCLLCCLPSQKEGFQEIARKEKTDLFEKFLLFSLINDAFEDDNTHEQDDF